MKYANSTSVSGFTEFIQKQSTDVRNSVAAVGSSQSVIQMRVSPPIEEHVGFSAREANSKGAEQLSKYWLFRRHCDQLRLEAEKIKDFMCEGVVTDEGLEVVVEVEFLLEQLYDCPWSECDNLKKVVVLLQSQLLNAKWTDKHARFLQEAIRILRLSYVINDDLVEQIFNLIDEFGLDQFRGTVSEAEVRKKYRIEEVH